MKTRDVVIYNGERFQVPQCIQRIDHRATHGWQLRYGGTKLYSDGRYGASAAEALAQATKELAKRMSKLPAPTRLKPEPSRSKSSELPVGISGPIVRERRPNRRDCSFTVLLPRFGEAPRRRSVYIAAESTYTIERYQEALEKAIALRQEAEELYRKAATKAKRSEGRALSAQLRGA
ncbi:hypothetical protein PFX98_24565 [Paucibacter sediminis]|uniref:AP2 domain-containing protein n=1 Tax=Paucibacter sediminis TaxID=3019553 RepID=A0AA95SW97_9BURK|nr:hypothetical protein [Paucibacter sp. S2-9]WIT12004.1 hypothetical protein PFX98_24565 [Paucibacter sp. S2-9]